MGRSDKDSDSSNWRDPRHGVRRGRRRGDLEGDAWKEKGRTYGLLAIVSGEAGY